MIGINIEDNPIFDAARERKLGEWKSQNIEVEGDYLTPPKLPKFKLPRAFKLRKSKLRINGNFNRLTKSSSQD